MKAIEELFEHDLLFDDEPLEAILYDDASPEPSSATAFYEARSRYACFEQALSNDNLDAFDQQLETLLIETIPVPLWMGAYLIKSVQDTVPTCPWPVLPTSHPNYCRLLERIYEESRAKHQPELFSASASMLYRWYEGQNDFAKARVILNQLLAIAVKEQNQHEVAIYTANLGYEYLLEQNWHEAMPWFSRSLQIFEDQGNKEETANLRANILTCRFAQTPQENWRSLLEELTDVNQTLSLNSDWRARKTLALLARYAESKDQIWGAVNWARRAVSVVDFEEIPTHHHLEDQRYLARLRQRFIDKFGKEPNT